MESPGPGHGHRGFLVQRNHESGGIVIRPILTLGAALEQRVEATSCNRDIFTILKSGLWSLTQNQIRPLTHGAIRSRSAEPVHRPRHDDIELPPAGVLVHGVEARALVAALGAANALVTVHRDDLMSRTHRHLAQRALLVLGCLMNLMCASRHRNGLQVVQNYSGLCQALWLHSVPD
jgi:hypothetical protein